MLFFMRPARAAMLSLSTLSTIPVFLVDLSITGNFSSVQECRMITGMGQVVAVFITHEYTSLNME